MTATPEQHDPRGYAKRVIAMRRIWPRHAIVRNELRRLSRKGLIRYDRKARAWVEATD